MGSSPFPRSLRLRARHEFTAVQNGGRRVASKYLTVLGQPNTGVHDRLGIIASRRLGGAVIRNRAKRRLRELFRRQAAEQASISGRPGEAAVRALDLVIIPRREFAAAPFPVIQADFQNAVRRLKGQR